MADRPALSPRLQAIARLVPPGSRLADIGTDHGYLPVSLLLSGQVSAAIAADLRREPLEHARCTAKQYGVEKAVSFRLCDGLGGISPEETDVIVVAGLGGDVITGILHAAPWTRHGKALLLQPMSKAEILRGWLAENGYRVNTECLAADRGILYPVLMAEGGSMPPVSPSQCWGGLLLRDDPLWGIYLEDRMFRLRRVVVGLGMAKDPALAQRRKELNDILEELTAWKEAWTHDHPAGNRNCPVSMGTPDTGYGLGQRGSAGGGL